MIDGVPGDQIASQSSIDQLHTENERLRAVLREIAGMAYWKGNEAARIARQALGETV